MGNKTQPIHSSAEMAREKAQVDDNDPNDKEKGPMTRRKTSPWVWGAMALLVVITYVTMPDPLQPPHGQPPSRQHVFYYGWLTAVFTGLGALPLAFAPNLASYWVGLSNGKFYHRTEEMHRFVCSCLYLFRCRNDIVR